MADETSEPKKREPMSVRDAGRKGGRRVAELVERAKQIEEPGVEPHADTDQESE